MDVTPATLNTIISMGGSGSPKDNYLSANKSLNFAVNSNSMLNAAPTRITDLPFTQEYSDTVGLFGAENYFVKVVPEIQSQSGDNIIYFGYLPAKIDQNATTPEADLYEDPVLDYERDLTVVETYHPAVIDNSLGTGGQRPLISVAINNKGTGNKFIDAWFDVRLYTSDRLEHPYDLLYIRPNDFCYVGFHARNTKRLPYDVELYVGQVVVSEYELPEWEKRYVHGI